MKQPHTRVQCARSPDGMHKLVGYAQVALRDGGCAIYLECRHCKASGRITVEDHQIEWPDAEKVPD